MNRNMIYNNEATKAMGPVPLLFDNPNIRGIRAMTERILSSINRESQDVHLCKCGCGEPVKWNRWDGCWNEYINHHHGKKYFSKSSINARKPRPLCECGCGQYVTWGKKNKTRWNKFIPGHNGRGTPRLEETKSKISETNKGHAVSMETRRKISEIQMGRRLSDEWKRNIAIGVAESRNTGQGTTHGGYCEAWADLEYINDLRKGSCEVCGMTRMLSFKIFNRDLFNHHINGKLNCTPEDIQTLCNGCHMREHWKLRRASKGK